MKFLRLIAALMLVALTGCTTVVTINGRPVPPPAPPPKDLPETVIVTYHVVAGREADFAALLKRAWGVYREEHMVRSDPHIIVRDVETDGKTRFVEIFTWVNHAAPAQAPASVRAIWSQEMADCEPRDGHRGLEGGEVELVSP